MLVTLRGTPAATYSKLLTSVIVVVYLPRIWPNDVVNSVALAAVSCDLNLTCCWVTDPEC